MRWNEIEESVKEWQEEQTIRAIQNQVVAELGTFCILIPEIG